MEVNDIQIGQSPISSRSVRLEGRVSFDDKTILPEVYWFDVPEKYAGFLSKSGNPWLACLIPLAVNLGEPLRISEPVDSVLFENVHELMHIWKCWYPHLHVVPIEARTTSAGVPPEANRTAAFFSGGVDAWFTLLRHSDKAAMPGASKLTDLLTVWGLDIPLDNPEAFGRMQAVQEDAATALELEPIAVATNLVRARSWHRADWGRVAHGSALAAIGLTLEGRFRSVLIPSTHRYDDLVPWGSHPLTDPLLSTSCTRCIHEGAGYRRVEKTAFLTRFEAAMTSLQVCWETNTYKNCENCNKCYRTMLTLMLLGALERCPTFTATTVDLKKVSKIFSQDESDRAFLREIQELAAEKGRQDIVYAIDKSFRHSRRLQTWLPLIRSLNRRHFVWRWAAPLERMLLTDSIVK